MKIVIADDHDLVRDALATLIERDQPGSEVLRASDFDAVMGYLSSHGDLDLVLLDVYMPGMNALESIRQLVDQFPKLPVVLMSGMVRRSDVDTGFEYGARGFIPKTMNGKALVSVLNLVIAGARYVPEIMLESEDSTAIDTFELSPREIDVLNQLAQGLTNKVIARVLKIEETTVKLHLRSLFRKLNVKNRTEAVIVARDAGLCEDFRGR
ncbi:MAG: two-component system nitrate/nitrite response regulator NarL [Rhodothermales bacterium]|jgi:two-component system nitrate/nitrite response regulator NarL